MESIIKNLTEAYVSCVAFVLADYEDSINRISSFKQIRSKNQRRCAKNEKSSLYNQHRDILVSLNSHNLKILKTIYARVADGSTRVHKSIWIKPRKSSFWDHDMLYFGEEDWIANFRMKKESFQKLFNLIKDEITPNLLYVREPVEPVKRFGIALYKIASCAEYRTVGNLFGVHKSTVKKFLHLFCEAVMKILFDSAVHMPSEYEAIQLANLTEAKTSVPMTVGFIDGCHIPVLPPEDGRRDFINRKQFASVVLQAVVDVNLKFRNVSCVVPGSCHDATALKESNLFKKPNSFLPNGTKEIEGLEVPFYLVGDPAYPLLPWLIKPYPHTSNMNPQRESFNVYISSARVPVEIAFGRLKGRWRIILKRVDLDYRFVPKLIAVCCVLHNFCESENSPVPQDMENILEMYNELYPQPVQRPSVHNTDEATLIRNTLCNYMSEFPLRSSVHW